MAKSIEEILGKSINSTKELKQAIKELQDQLVTASQGTEEWADTADKLTAAQAKLNEVMNAGKTGMDAVDDSIVGMERRYKELYSTYKLLSDEQRNSPFGSEMRMELEKLSNKLNETKKGVGNFKDNIGRYAQDATAAFSQMGIGIGGLAGPLNLANGGFKVLNATMLANPVFWLIAGLKVLIGIFNKVKEAIAGNEESQMRLNQAMAAFQPIIDSISNYFDKLGQRVVTVIEWISQAYTKIREISAAVTDFLGITDGEKKRIQEQNKVYADLAKRANELTLAKREQAKLNASQQAEVKTLLDQAAGTADATEKMNILNEAKRIQQEITERNISIAQEEYDILLEKSKLTANDAEMNDKLAESEAAVARARAEGAEKTKEMTSQILSLSKANNGNSEALKKEKEELASLLKTIDENSKTEIQKLEDKYKKELDLLKKYGKDTTQLTKQYEDEKLRIETESMNEYTSKYRATVLEAANGIEPETSFLKKLFAESDLEWVQHIFDEAKNEVSKYLNESSDDFNKKTKNIEAIWSAAGAKIGGEYKWIRSLDDAKNVLKILKQGAKDAANEYERIVNTAIPSQDFALSLVKSKIDIMGNQELTYEEKIEWLKELDDSLLEKQMENALWEIENLDLTNQQKLEKYQEYYDALSQLEENQVARKQEKERKAAELDGLQYERNMNLIDSNIGILDSIGALSDAISQNIERTMDDADETEESVKKKKKALKTLQDIQMAVSLAAIAADTAAGIMGIWRGYALEKVANAETAAATGPAAAVTLTALNAKSLVSAILNTVGMGVMGAAQMAAVISGTISNKKAIEGSESSGGGGGVAGTIAAPAIIESTPYSYTRQIQTAEEEDALNRPIWVSVTDIENGLNHAQVVQSESTW